MKALRSFPVLLLILLSVISAFSQQTPNIIIINMDDMAYEDIGAFGASAYRTPNMDALASAGLKFTNFYSAQATCSASRTALLTGCYPNRLGISGALMPTAKIALNPDEETMAALLKKKGYRTCITGKWHLGSQPAYYPARYGFDEFLGLPYSNDMWPVDYDGLPFTDTSNWRSKYPPLPLIENDQVVTYIKTLKDQSRLTGIYTQKAVSFIKTNKNNRFFLYVAHSMPHVPIAASENFLGRSGAGLFGDVITELDWSVGEIMKALRENGLDSNTLIILTSDNGPWLSFGNHAGNRGRLREGKGTIWDGGLKVPFIICWKGKIRPGNTCKAFATNMDLLPALARICHTGLPAKKIDGTDISKLFFFPRLESPRNEFAYYYDKNNLKAVRNKRYKLVFPHVSQTYLPDSSRGADGYPGKYATMEISESLYDLDKDPGETNNLADSLPETLSELKLLAEKYRKELGDGITKRTGEEIRPPAKVKTD